MANVYKTIGNTAAAVASLFAVGTLLWWQRSPTPIIDAPRPQDEAEIMTAILERHAAMGRTNAAFVRTIPEVTYTTPATNNAPGAISNVVGSVTNWFFLRTNAPATSLTNIIGFFPNAPDRYSSAARYAFAPSWYYAGDWAPGTEWIDGTGMNFDSSGYNEWRPSQEFYFDDRYQFRPSWKASAWMPPVGWVSPDELNTYWIIPDNSYMDSGAVSWFDRETPYLSASNVFSPPLSFVYFFIFDGTEVETYINTYCSEERRVWTNYVTKSLATWRTTTNYVIESTHTNISGTTTNTYTQTVYTVTNYINTANYDTYAHLVQDYFISAMQFAYERDTPGNGKCFDLGHESAYAYPTYTHKQQFWSTNKYNDIGRALSLLQWIKQPKSPSSNSYWFVEYIYTTANNPSGSQVSYTETNAVGSGVTHPSTGRSYAMSGTNYVNRAWGTMVSYDFPNPIPFTVDTIQWQVTAESADGFAPNSSRPATIAGPVVAGGSASSGWWPRHPDTLRAELEAFVRNTTYNSASNITFSATLQECYHVQFSALTNYANHAPAR